MAIDINKTQIEGTTVLSLHGRLGEAESQAVQQAFLDTFDEGCFQLVVDFTEVDFMTSSGLGALMMCMKHTRENDGFIRIANPQPLIRQVLQTTRLHHFLRMFPTVQEALQNDERGQAAAEPS